ncbi:MAG: DUF1285 domain-containing protein [Pseudomonadota bacterium]
MSAAGTALNKLVSQIADAKRGSKSRAAPVEQWDPPFCGDIDLEIRADGTWFYLGTPIGRPALVQLFASVLRKDDDGKTYLVTPVEKVGIRVVDAPFVVVRIDRVMASEGPAIAMTTNVGDEVIASPAFPLRFETQKETMGVKPYVYIRGRLEALLSRACTHELMDMGEHAEIDGTSYFALRSSGRWFPVMESAQLEAAIG